MIIIKVFYNANIYTGETEIRQGYLIIDSVSGIIEAVGTGTMPQDREYFEEIDCRGKIVFPGMIDIHTHGALGLDFMYPDEESLLKVRDFFFRNGVTGFLATTVAAPEEELIGLLANYRDYIRNIEGLLGIHLEGPYLSLEKAGAQGAEYFLDVDSAIVPEFMDIIKILTVAPERDRKGWLPLWAEQGLCISAGHTNAKYVEGITALNYLSSVTHCFNAMPAMHHRKPGITTALLLADIYKELIADLRHVRPGFIKLLYSLNPDKVILVSDSISATGLTDGEYHLGREEVIVKGGVAYLSASQDTLAGSTLLLRDALINYADVTGNREAAIAAATSHPAKLLELKDRGVLERGRRADFNIADEELNLIATYVRGEKICV